MEEEYLCEVCRTPLTGGEAAVCPACLLREALDVATGRDSQDDVDPEPDELLGARVGAYEILAPIGAGGMGRVYQARHQRLGRLVAVKVLPPGSVSDPHRKRRFLGEAKAASSLHHPNIVTVFDLLKEGGRDFLVMEYVEGPNLAQLMAEGKIQLAKTLRYATHIAGALAAAHRVGLVHRDTKPSNVMIAEGDTAKLLDFGLAKLLDGSGIAASSSWGRTRDGVVVGTVHYMSPEQALGNAVDHRSDIFSFGSLLYEMLIGQRAFDGDSAPAVLHALAYSSPTPLLEQDPGLPPGLTGLVDQALEKDPADRISSMQDVVSRLETVASDLSGPPSPVPKRGRGSPVRGMPVRGWPVWGWPVWGLPVWTFSLGAVLVAGAVILFLLLSRGGTEGPGQRPHPSASKAATEAADTPGPYQETLAGLSYLDRFDRLGNLDLAIASFERAIVDDTKYSPAYAGLARAQLDRFLTENRDPVWLQRADGNSHRAVELEPHLATGLAVRGLVLIRLGKLEEAQRVLERALDLDPREVEAHRAMAELDSARGDWAGAVDRLDHALQLEPGQWRLYAAKAEKLHAAGHYRRAEAACRAWLELTPDNVYAHQTLGGVLSVLGDLDGASAALQEALRIRPEADVYSNLGTILYFRGRYGEAAEAYRRAVELKPNQRVFWSNLGDALRWAPGRRDDAPPAYLRAIQLLRAALAKVPEDPSLISELAEYQAKSGDVSGALGTLDRLEEKTATDPEVWFSAAKSYEIAGSRDRALRSLERALSLGYSTSEVQLEPELLELRKDLRYHRLLTRLATSP